MEQYVKFLRVCEQQIAHEEEHDSSVMRQIISDIPLISIKTIKEEYI